MMNIKPLLNNIIVKPTKNFALRTPSGLTLPESEQGFKVGEVIDCVNWIIEQGKQVSSELKTGDFVIYSPWATPKCRVQTSALGEELLIFNVQDMLGKITNLEIVVQENKNETT